MASVVRKLMPIAVTGGVVLLGWGLMKALSPSKEDMMKVGCSSEGLNTSLTSAASLCMQRLSPEELERLPEIEKRNAEIMQALKESASSNDPIWKVQNIDRTTNQPNR